MQWWCNQTRHPKASSTHDSSAEGHSFSPSSPPRTLRCVYVTVRDFLAWVKTDLRFFKMCKPLQFCNICLDAKHKNGILLRHACCLIFQMLSTFLMEFIYHSFIQSLKWGFIWKKSLWLSKYFFVVVSLSLKIISHYRFFLLLFLCVYVCICVSLLHTWYSD